jgi:hypothetical protein
LLGGEAERSQPDPPMPAVFALAAKVFDVAVVALIFTAFS